MTTLRWKKLSESMPEEGQLVFVLHSAEIYLARRARSGNLLRQLFAPGIDFSLFSDGEEGEFLFHGFAGHGGPGLSAEDIQGWVPALDVWYFLSNEMRKP